MRWASRTTSRPTKAADAFVQGLVVCLARVGIPMRLSEVGVTEQFIPHMARDAAESHNAKVNPRIPTVEEVESLYREALSCVGLTGAPRA